MASEAGGSAAGRRAASEALDGREAREAAAVHHRCGLDELKARAAAAVHPPHALKIAMWYN